MFVGMRSKSCIEFAEAPCKRIEPVTIWPWDRKLRIERNGVKFFAGPKTLEKIARHDGFLSIYQFFDFFKLYKSWELRDFEIIYWDPEKLNDFTVHMSDVMYAAYFGQERDHAKR
jgi:hypothetical protein